jgi:SAM-dependent methyltransferase
VSVTPTPAPLLELATAYQRSRILHAFIRLEIPSMLAGATRSAAEIGSRIGADPVAADRFLNACVDLGLLVRDENGFHDAPVTQRFLLPGTPSDLTEALVRHDRMSGSQAWAQIAARLRSWRRGGCALSGEGNPLEGEIEGLHRLSLLAGEALGRAIDLSRRRRLLDLGGGTGAMSIGLCRRFPDLGAVIVERPEVAPVAREFVKACGLGERIEVREGDFLKCPIPGGDVALLANVMSMLSVEASRHVLGRIHQHLPADGMIVLSGWMLDDDETGPLLPALLCLEDILLGAPEVERSAATYASWLGEAGFIDIAHGSYFEPARYVAGYKR